MNKFLCFTRFNSPGYGPQLHVSSCIEQRGLNRLFKAHGVTGMLQVKAHKEFADRLCDLEENASLGAVFIRYTDISQELFHAHHTLPWTSARIDEINYFTNSEIDSFELYQHCRLATVKISYADEHRGNFTVVWWFRMCAFRTI